MLTVTDVEASSQWLQTVFALKSAHGGPEFEMLADGSGRIVLWLHRHDANHEHPQTAGIDLSHAGAGVSFYLCSDDIDAAYERAKEVNAAFIEELHHNPLASHREFTVKSPDGYLFAAHSLRASADDQQPGSASTAP